MTRISRSLLFLFALLFTVSAFVPVSADAQRYRRHHRHHRHHPHRYNRR